MIIGLSGLKQSGKDTAAAYLVKEYGFERRSFADPLKKSVAALLDIPFHEIEKYKNDKYALVSFTAMRGKEPIKQVFTFREFLQRYGTESHRDIPEMSNDFWVNLSLPIGGYYVGRNIVVTDCRFKNEVDRIHQLSGVVVKISRETAATSDQDPHSSEAEMVAGIGHDYEIHNNKAIVDLYTSIEKIITREYRLRVGIE